MYLTNYRIFLQGIVRYEKRLFSLLQKAYIDALYGQDFSVQVHDIIILTERVKRLHDLLEEYAQTMLETG